jgi:hypothetical protein
MISLHSIGRPVGGVLLYIDKLLTKWYYLDNITTCTAGVMKETSC